MGLFMPKSATLYISHSPPLTFAQCRNTYQLCTTRHDALIKTNKKSNCRERGLENQREIKLSARKNHFQSATVSFNSFILFSKFAPSTVRHGKWSRIGITLKSVLSIDTFIQWGAGRGHLFVCSCKSMSVYLIDSSSSIVCLRGLSISLTGCRKDH